MELSVDLPDEDVTLLDQYVKAAGLPSRSVGLQHAIRLLRRSRLEEDYAAAWDEWTASGEREAWEGTTADGLGHSPPRPVSG